MVYLAQRDAPNSPELYWVRATGGPAVEINGPLVEGGAVTTFWMAPDSASVFYTAEEEVFNVRDL